MKIDELIAQEMKSEEFAQEYRRNKERSASAIALYNARKAVGLTQSELALKANMTQASVSRIERGDNATFDSLEGLAHAMGKSLKIDFV